MKKLITYILILNCLLIAACKTAPKELEETEILNPKTIVEVVNVKSGTVDDELILSATTVYLKRDLVTATIPAFITNVRVKLGDAVNKGEVLYELESKERRALGNSIAKLDTSLTNFGIIKVKASASGIISTLDKQEPGDYVLEGSLLCTIAESGDLAFQVNVPYEFTKYTKQGNGCTIVLPDNSIHNAQFTRSLTSMNAMAQTQTILAKADENLFLPENMIVEVMINKGTSGNKQVLPRKCLLSDEMMSEYWVMKLINDTTAVKVLVNVGDKNATTVEIISPKFNETDRIVSVGNYGLPDTAGVKIISSNK